MTYPNDVFPVNNNSGDEKIKQFCSSFIQIPERVESENQDTINYLSNFLVDKGYIKQIKMWHGSWGFEYHSSEKTLYISEYDMPQERYEYFTFRLGKNYAGEQLFPTKQEMDIYRFIHEVGHAYQFYLVDTENEHTNNWYENAINGRVDTTFAKLFKHCYLRRSNIPNETKGLSTWGNQPDYNSIEDRASQNAVRALEDCNELVNTYLWNPKYFETYMDYLSATIPGYGYESIKKDSLVLISDTERRKIKTLVTSYVNEMKVNISGN